MRHHHRKISLLPLFLLATCYITSAHAGEHEQRTHNAHEHGHGQLNIAVEQHLLHIELQSPAMNIVGFEHQARNEGQRQAIAHAITLLKQGDKLFLTPAAAGCTLLQAEVMGNMLASHQNQAHTDEAHADFSAGYRFECNHPDKLDQLSVKLFAAFPAIEELEVQLLSERGQSSSELTPANPQLNF